MIQYYFVRPLSCIRVEIVLPLTIPECNLDKMDAHKLQGNQLLGL